MHVHVWHNPCMSRTTICGRPKTMAAKCQSSAEQLRLNVQLLRSRAGSVVCRAHDNTGRRQAGLMLAAAGLSVVADAQASAAASAPACTLTTTPSGLSFCDTKEGGGDEAQPGTLVRVHYDGRLESTGAKFDSSYDRGAHSTARSRPDRAWKLHNVHLSRIDMSVPIGMWCMSGCMMKDS
jgi:hypothetical protein